MNTKRTKAIEDLQQEIKTLKDELDMLVEASKTPHFPTEAIVELVEYIRSLGNVTKTVSTQRQL